MIKSLPKAPRKHKEVGCKSLTKYKIGSIGANYIKYQLRRQEMDKGGGSKSLWKYKISGLGAKSIKSSEKAPEKGWKRWIQVIIQVDWIYSRGGVS